MLNADEMQELQGQISVCSRKMAQAMFHNSENKYVGVLAAVKVAAAALSATGADRETAIEIFTGYFDKAEDFMGDKE